MITLFQSTEGALSTLFTGTGLSCLKFQSTTQPRNLRCALVKDRSCTRYLDYLTDQQGSLGKSSTWHCWHLYIHLDAGPASIQVKPESMLPAGTGLSLAKKCWNASLPCFGARDFNDTRGSFKSSYLSHTKCTEIGRLTGP